jgi:site-specific recombinase XerD
MDITSFKHHQETFLTFCHVEKNLSQNTLRAYKGDLDQFVAFWSEMTDTDKEHLELRQIIERYLVSLFYKKIDKPSIARKFSCFTSFTRYLKSKGITLDLKLKRPRLDKKLPVFLTIDEITYLLDSIEDEKMPSKKPARDKAILELLYATGIRCSELVHITCGDIDMMNKTIRIKGKGNQERMVLFGTKAHERIMSYLERERPIFHDADEYLFLNNRSGKLTSRTIQRIIASFRPFLDVERAITPHKIRHTFATHMLNQGVDLRVVQELLGHKSLSSTQIYTHVSLEDLAKMCDTIHPIKSLKITQ